MKVSKDTCTICGEAGDVVKVGTELICYACACEIVTKLEESEDEDED